MPSNSTDHRDKLRRLRILQRLAQAFPRPMGELALLYGLRTDPELDPTVEHVRQALEYLDDFGLVRLITVPGSDWLAANINTNGMAWLESPSDLGLEIYNPGEQPETSTQRRGKVSSVELLPPEVKAWIDQALARRDRTYEQLVGALTAQGYEISKSAMGRYGKKFRDEQKALKQSIEMAKAFAEVVGDDGAAMNQTLTALAQQELMSVIREGRYDADDIKLPALIQSIAQLNRQNLSTLKYQLEQAARRKALNEAAETAEKSLQGRGMSREAVATIKREILGIA